MGDFTDGVAIEFRKAIASISVRLLTNSFFRTITRLGIVPRGGALQLLTATEKRSGN